VKKLMAFYRLILHSHWQEHTHDNQIESTFATIRHRTKTAKGCLTDKGCCIWMSKARRVRPEELAIDCGRSGDFPGQPVDYRGSDLLDGVEETDKPKRKAA